MQTANLNLLEHSWTANVRLKNGLEMTIWYTAFPSMKDIIDEVLWVASDLPKHKIAKQWISK